MASAVNIWVISSFVLIRKELLSAETAKLLQALIYIVSAILFHRVIPSPVHAITPAYRHLRFVRGVALGILVVDFLDG